MIANNALVSTMHCVLMKGPGAGGGGVVIKDTSTNGTLLNGKKMVKGEEVTTDYWMCIFLMVHFCSRCSWLMAMSLELSSTRTSQI